MVQGEAAGGQKEQGQAHVTKNELMYDWDVLLWAGVKDNERDGKRYISG